MYIRSWCFDTCFLLPSPAILTKAFASMNLEVKCRNCAFIKLGGCYMVLWKVQWSSGQRPCASNYSPDLHSAVCTKFSPWSCCPSRDCHNVLAVHDVLHEFVCQGAFAVLKLEYGRIVWPKLRIVWPAPILTTKAAMRWTASLLWRLPTTISARCTGEWQCSGLSYGVK